MRDGRLPDRTLLGDARWWLRRRVDKGAKCPLCTQHAMIYPRTINSSQARDLIALYLQHEREFAYLPDVRKLSGSRSNREESKLRWWGLLIEEPTLRPDGGRAGWWKVTDRGEQFVLNQVRVPKTARVYDNRCLKLVGEPISIVDALGNPFDYRELMGRDG